ncbi:hypothetical protein HYFRA_00014176 [Hymenoscyphus fraxineus]|uniref:Yeast cell wall synthesis Kre9/Knh1 C-terminal domain-containing protein n=1 Tax=Hymenoscyphus fraxineus TaxID=746836 RepID=A0A9N9LCD4_9HELO|nr:hypothetical protein HYFRA_00014176 [Hymenoscyphus fraxineus]
MRLSTAALLALSLPFSLAIPIVTAPTTNAAGTAFIVTITDSGAAPLLTSLAGYQLQLFAGNDATRAVVWTDPVPGTFPAGTTKTVTIPAAIGGNLPNAYFFGVLATATSGGTITTFSNRFTMSGMTGTFPANVVATGITSTAGPPPVNAIAAAPQDNQPIREGVSSDFAIPYTMQTGTVRYAPMQPVPPTKITATNTNPLWPTSAVQFAATFMPIPTIVTTKTQAATFSVSSHPNPVPASTPPANDMQKFLNRWKD